MSDSPTIAEVAEVLHQLAAAVHLDDGHPDRIAAIAAKRAILDRITAGDLVPDEPDAAPLVLVCTRAGCGFYGEPVETFAYRCAACGADLDEWPVLEGPLS